VFGYVVSQQQTRIPEPPSAVLLALGLAGPLGVAGLRRRRQHVAAQ